MHNEASIEYERIIMGLWTEVAQNDHQDPTLHFGDGNSHLPRAEPTGAVGHLSRYPWLRFHVRNLRKCTSLAVRIWTNLCSVDAMLCVTAMRSAFKEWLEMGENQPGPGRNLSCSTLGLHSEKPKFIKLAFTADIRETTNLFSASRFMTLCCAMCHAVPGGTSSARISLHMLRSSNLPPGYGFEFATGTEHWIWLDLICMAVEMCEVWSDNHSLGWNAGVRHDIRLLNTTIVTACSGWDSTKETQRMGDDSGMHQQTYGVVMDIGSFPNQNISEYGWG